MSGVKMCEYLSKVTYILISGAMPFIEMLISDSLWLAERDISDSHASMVVECFANNLYQSKLFTDFNRWFECYYRKYFPVRLLIDKRVLNPYHVKERTQKSAIIACYGSNRCYLFQLSNPTIAGCNVFTNKPYANFDPSFQECFLRTHLAHTIIFDGNIVKGLYKYTKKRNMNMQMEICYSKVWRCCPFRILQ